MTSSNITMNRLRDREIDGRWPGRDGDVLIEVKRTNNIRDIRDGLLSLTYVLAAEPQSTTALLCVLMPQSRLLGSVHPSRPLRTRLSRLSPTRLKLEIEYFRSVVRPNLAQRVRLIGIEDTESGIKLPYEAEPNFQSWLEDVVAREATGVRGNRQTVTSALALSWLRGEGPLTVRSLQDLCGASYPTVATAVENLTSLDLLEPRSDRRLLVRYIPLALLMKIAEQHAAGRKIHRFIDPTGQVKSPETLSAKLFKLQQQGLATKVAVGGVLGARHYFSDLDITASPRLDLSVYSAGGLDFVRRLDAALEETEDARAKAALVVHVTPEPVRFIDHHDGTWASELECCADLLEIGLTREAHEMMTVLSGRRLSKLKVRP
jgi:hypothetical protein